MEQEGIKDEEKATRGGVSNIRAVVWDIYVVAIVFNTMSGLLIIRGVGVLRIRVGLSRQEVCLPLRVVQEYLD